MIHNCEEEPGDLLNLEIIFGLGFKISERLLIKSCSDWRFEQSVFMNNTHPNSAFFRLALEAGLCRSLPSSASSIVLKCVEPPVLGRGCKLTSPAYTS